MRIAFVWVLLLSVFIGFAACGLTADAVPPQEQRSSSAKTRFNRLDRNGSGYLEFNEFRRQAGWRNASVVEAMRRRFQTMCGSDNRIDEVEFTRAVTAPPRSGRKPRHTYGDPIEVPWTDMVVDIDENLNTFDVLIYAPSVPVGKDGYWLYYAKTYPPTGPIPSGGPFANGAEYIGEGSDEYLYSQVTETNGGHTHPLPRRRLAVWERFLEDEEDPTLGSWPDPHEEFFYPHADPPLP